MAVVKGPAFSMEASGNVGPVCFSKWRNLQVAKAVWTGTVPNTTKQIAQQALMTSVSQAWGGSAQPAERETWKDLAKSIVWRDRLGSPYVPTGYQLFMKWNIRRLVMGLALMITAPAEQAWEYVEEIVYLVADDFTWVKVKMLKAAGLSPDSYGVEYYKAGPYDSGGRHAIDGEWLFLNRQVPPASFTDNAVVHTKWYWYRGRAISFYGGVQNWFEIQVYNG